MNLNPYLVFDGTCRKAFEFYAKVLGGKIVAMMTRADMPSDQPSTPEQRDLIIHARMAIGDKLLMGSDAPADRFQKMQGFMVTLGIDEPAEAERVYNGALGGRHRRHATDRNVLGPEIRHADRPVRHAVDDQLREAEAELTSSK
jgi:PhnB protein